MTYDLFTRRGWAASRAFLFPRFWPPFVPGWIRWLTWARYAVYDTLGRPLCANHGHYLFGRTKALLTGRVTWCTRCAAWVSREGVCR